MTVSRRLALVWIGLLALTFSSAVIGFEQRGGFEAQATLIVIGIALFKARLIGMHYMDLRSAPVALRIVFDGYLFVVFTVLVMIDLVVRP